MLSLALSSSMRGSPFGAQTHHFPCHGPASAWRHSSGEGLQAATGIPCELALCGLGGAKAHVEGLALNLSSVTLAG